MKQTLGIFNDSIKGIPILSIKKISANKRDGKICSELWNYFWRILKIKGRKKSSCDAGIQILLKCSDVSLKVLQNLIFKSIG
jgi:hypothetical protein